jgi:hypothetical protein
LGNENFRNILKTGSKQTMDHNVKKHLSYSLYRHIFGNVNMHCISQRTFTEYFFAYSSINLLIWSLKLAICNIFTQILTSLKERCFPLTYLVMSTCTAYHKEPLQSNSLFSDVHVGSELANRYPNDFDNSMYQQAMIVSNSVCFGSFHYPNVIIL